MDIPFIQRIIWPIQQLYAQGKAPPTDLDADRRNDSQLHHLCSLNIPENEAHNGRTAQKTIREIQVYLDILDNQAKRFDNQKWSYRPRLYAILRNIGALGYMDAFIAARLTDFHLPLNSTTVPGCLKGDSQQHLRDAFIKAQCTYLTKARCIEEGHDSRHWILPPHTSGDDYYVPEKRLGHGSFGSVDLVFSRLSIERYARKRVLRARSEQSRRNEEALLNELKELRQLQHNHLVKIFGSYTDREYIAYIMKPIAEATLAQFLGRPTPLEAEDQEMLRRFYGCLAGAVDYLHRNCIRHRDLTARNVLICRGDVYISDFGSAYNWANKPGSMTRHRNTPVSPDYMAPEVAGDEYRGTASDMWSLGVVYLEMTTKLLGRTVRELKNVLAAHAKAHKVSPHPYANIPAIFSWIEELGNRDAEYDHDKEPLLWVRSLLDTQPENRPSARILMQDIHESPSFGAFCCFKCQPAYQDEATEHPIEERNGPTVDSQNTSAIVENFMEAFERQSSFGGMSVQRVDSIKEWVSGTTSSNTEDIKNGNQLDDIQEEAMPDDTARLTDKLHYDSYESKYYTSIAAKDPDPTQWGHLVEELAVPGSFPVFEFDGQKGKTISDLPLQHHMPMPTQKVDKKNLQDSGLGFLEYESASSDNADEVLDLCNEVSDNSTVNSDMPETEIIGDDLNEITGASEGEDDFDQPESRGHDPEEPPKTIDMLFGEVDDESDTEIPSENLVGEVSDTSNKGHASDSSMNAEPAIEQLLDEKDKPSDANNIRTNPNMDEESVVENDYIPVTVETVIDEDFVSQQPPKTRMQQYANAFTRLVDYVAIESQGTATHAEKSFTTPHSRADSVADTNVISHADILTDNQSPVKLQPQSKTRSKKTQVKKVRIGNSFYTAPGSAGGDYPSEETKLPRNKGTTKKSRRPAERGELPVIDVDKLILETWDLASSMPTSVLSEDTKSSIVKFFLMIPNVNHIENTLTGHCRNGKASAVRYILENMRSSYKIPKTFFRGPIWACVKGASSRHNKCLRALIEADANIKIKSKKTGKTPLHMAVEHDDFKGYTNLIWLLINNGADPNVKDSSGDCPLTKLFAGNDSSALKKHRLGALAILLQGGAKVDSTQPGTGNTPLHLAVRRQDRLAVAILLYKGANVNAKTTWGTTPLQITANQFRGNLTGDHAQVLDLLLRNNADVDEPAGLNKRTALHRAVVTGTAQAVEMLLRYGADPSLKDTSGKDARDLAVAHAAKLTQDINKSSSRRIDDHVEIMERLFQDRKHDWPMNKGRCVVDLACDGSQVEGHGILTELLSMGLAKNAKFGEKGTISELALRHGCPEVKRLFR